MSSSKRKKLCSQQIYRVRSRSIPNETQQNLYQIKPGALEPGALEPWGAQTVILTDYSTKQKGFRSNFHASIFSNVSNFNLKYLHDIQRTQNTFSHNIMRSTIRAMCSKRNELNKQIIECRSQLSNVCPSVLL